MSSVQKIFTSFLGIAMGGGRRKTNHPRICKDEAAERESVILCLQSAVSLTASLLITSAGKMKIYNSYIGSQYFVSFTHRN